MPRPPAAKANRSRIIGVRFTPQERTVVEGKAETAGLSLSDYVRETFLQGSGVASNAPGAQGEAVSAATSPATEVVAPTLPGGELAPSYDPPGVFRRSWAEEREYMMTLSPVEVMQRFDELAAGRTLPAGFQGWSKDEKIEWLDREWPL